MDEKPREQVAWTEETDAILKGMWEDHSSKQIAEIMNRTRNSVIGRAHRLRLKNKGSKRWEGRQSKGLIMPVPSKEIPLKPKKRRKRSHSFKLKSSDAERLPPQYVPPVEPWSGSGVPFMQATRHHCRAIMGSSVDSRGLVIFCGEPIPEGSRFSFCEHHHSIYTYRMR